MAKIKTLIAAFCLVIAAGLSCWAQQPNRRSEGVPGEGTASAEFLREADEVLAEMSKLLSLPVKQPLKKVYARERISGSTL